MTTPFRPRLAALAAAAALGSSSAMALDYSGYFRAGPGLTSAHNTSRACYGLNGGSPGMKYRLGNECDFYGEFLLSQGFTKDGIEYSGNLMVNHYNAGTDTNNDGIHIEQMWAEAKGFDIAPQATFWLGKERGRRGDVHIVDTYFVEMAGVGAGFRGQPLGPGKIGAAFYRTDSDSAHPGTRLNVEYMGVPVNEGGTLNVFATATKGDFDGGTHGAGFSIRHDQKDIFGAGTLNMLWLQFSAGSAALNSNFGDLTRRFDNKSWRLVERLDWQKGPLGGQAMALLAREKGANGVNVDSQSLGGRISYGFTKNFKLLAEAGVSSYKPDNGERARLTKVTIAPTLSTGPGFYDRPEFRLYVTHANWNTAAGNVTGQAAFADKTSGTSYGAQVEMWF